MAGAKFYFNGFGAYEQKTSARKYYIIAFASIANAIFSLNIVNMEISEFGSMNQASREQSTGWMIKILAAWVDKQADLDLNPIGLSKSEFAILMCLLEEDGLTQVEIGENIAMPGYATTRNIDKLEILNLLKRHPHESSRRSHRIHLTPQGRKLGPRLISIARNINKNILDTLDENDRETFCRLLSQVVKRVTSDTPKR